jgi:Tol biopolymer transport system component
LVTGGCCVQPFFSPDGSRVLFLDKPAPDAPTGLWAVTLTQPLQTPALFSQRLGPFSDDMAFNAFLQNGRTMVERTSDGQQWSIDNGGRRVSFSPDNAHIAWVVSEQSGNFDVRKGDIYLANVDGSNARLLATLYGGGVQGWFHDSQRLLVSGKAQRDDITPTLSILNVADGSLNKLIDVERARSILLSPDDRWIAYYVSQARDEAQDGMYVLDVTQERPQPLRLDFFGAYRWCSPTRLYYVPMQTDAPSQSLWRFDVTTLQSTPVITAGADSSFRISNGDWDLSPDGRHVVYVNAIDHNIWLITLPEACSIS